MLIVDQYAYSNQLSSVHPVEKMIFSLTTLLIALISNSIIVSVVVIFVMSGLLVLKAKIPKLVFLKLLLVPLSFIIMGLIPIIISVTTSKHDFIVQMSYWGLTLGISSANLITAVELLFRTTASVCCLYFLALTTPMIEINSMLRKLKIPAVFIEFMNLVYRLLFILLDTAHQIKVAQLSRGGYSSIKNTFTSLAYLGSNLLVKAYYRAKKLSLALKARGYKGKIEVLERDHHLSKRNLSIIAVTEIVLVIFSILVEVV
ncbi:cobalt ECF transporter T component CbiQ [Halanaerobacter jeridensis]|uniref:Cobalt/nickel transport system permease protein n=1 Tax=Halanaerobacter jeridensis TaxID=706427 RepID=A0A938XXJ0_9FIRM|nr:cobalt ECF transporter T component CbiQ [Halanaerobacter jeridensis]MBM7557130.1 cobalt/nickel transport system permease protein [Halanaerobacter jeridensis]